MKRLIIFFLASIGAVTITFLILLLWGGKKFLDYEDATPTKITPNTVLTLHIGGKPLTESLNSSPLAWPFLDFKSKDSLKGTILKLERASQDKRVKGLILMIEGSEIDLAQVQELRQALEKFRNNGKFLYAFASTFGDFSNGTIAYYLATTAEQIWLQPLGLIGLTGLNIEIPFAKDALTALNLNPRIARREQYKSFPESFTENDFTAAYRENVTDLMKNLMAQLVQDMAKDRKLDAKVFEKLINQGPWLGKEGLEHKLIDTIGYFSEMQAKIKMHLDAEPTYLTLRTYGRQTNKQKADARIAVVFLEGLIAHARNYAGETNKDWGASDEPVIQGLRQAAKDNNIKAIILRINSSGGSAIASETIWHEIKEIVARGKPVVVSMGNMAASGGYFIATAASKVVANRATLTGSIGVFAGKILTTGLWDQLGIHWRVINQNDNAGMWSWHQDYTKHGSQRLQSWVDEVYESFLQKVVDGRKLDKAKVHDLAKGRVWTGEQALEKGLVDALGGFMKAIELTKQEAGLDVNMRIKLEEFPHPQTYLERIVSLFSGRISIQNNAFIRRIQSWITTLLHPQREALEIAPIRLQG